MDGNLFIDLSFPCPREAQNKTWATEPEAPEEKSFEILILHIHMHREANLTSP